LLGFVILSGKSMLRNAKVGKYYYILYPSNEYKNTPGDITMKLYEAIKDLADNEWLDISEVKRDEPLHIGRITKELLKGEILEREVVKHLTTVDSSERGYNIYRFYVEEKKEIYKFD